MSSEQQSTTSSMSSDDDVPVQANQTPPSESTHAETSEQSQRLSFSITHDQEQSPQSPSPSFSINSDSEQSPQTLISITPDLQEQKNDSVKNNDNNTATTDRPQLGESQLSLGPAVTPVWLEQRGYLLTGTLHRGDCGEVYVATYENKNDGGGGGGGTNQMLACKLYRRHTPDRHSSVLVEGAQGGGAEVMDESKHRLRFYRTECDILRHLNRWPHPSLMYAREVIDAPVDANEDGFIGAIIMPLISNGTLASAMAEWAKSNPSRIHPRALLWYRDLVVGLRYLHLNGIAHRDLKLENCLLGQRQRVVLTDFGFGCRVPIEDVTKLSEEKGLLTHCNSTLLGSMGKMAPELMVLIIAGQEGRPCPRSKVVYKAKPVDIYALGVCLFEMLNQAPPFNENDKDEETVPNESKSKKEKEPSSSGGKKKKKKKKNDSKNHSDDQSEQQTNPNTNTKLISMLKRMLSKQKARDYRYRAEIRSQVGRLEASIVDWCLSPEAKDRPTAQELTEQLSQLRPLLPDEVKDEVAFFCSGF